MRQRRFLSILLSLVLVLGMLPGMSLTASAEGNTTEITPTNPSGNMIITLKIKPAQTITASDVTATYGDTDKSVSASVTTPTTGGGAITYAVKSGSENYIDVAADGKLTIKAVPPTDGKAYVIVTAAETDDYAETTKEVTVTISNAPPVITLSEFPETYDGSPKKLISSVAYSGTEDLYLRVDCLTSFKNKISWAKYTGSSDLTNVFAPTNPGLYSVYYFVGTPNNPEGGTRVDGQCSIDKARPKSNNFTFTAPNSLNYDGNAKTATVTTKDGVNGMGEVTVKYYSDRDRNNEVNECKNAGTYYVGIDVGYGENYIDEECLYDRYDDSWKFTITPSTPSAPNAPTMASATKNSITLNAVDGCEYSKDGANWQSGTEFTGLLPSTEYTFYQRVKATTNTNPSAASQDATFSTEADTYALTITLVIVDKDTQTITAADMTVTYGDTGKTVIASVSEPATGGGAISYAVKDGSEDYIEVDPSTGALTIKKAGTATVIVTAAETDNYAAATKEVTVTINKANAAAATVTANNRTFDGTEKPLVNVTGEATGGEMQYAHGTETEATGDFTATIPSKTDVGTYYVWYKVVGDGNHNDYTATAPVTATIAKANASITAPTALNLTYTGQAQTLVVAGSTNDGEMQYSLDGVSYSATIPTGTEAKTYSVWYKVVGDSNHNDTAPAKIEVKINPASASPTAPTADTLNYTGEPQALVTGGSVTGGELQYALGEDADTAPALESFTTTVPTGTDAGDYFVWYRVKGDANHNDVAPACIPVSIAKAAIAPTVSLTGWTYGEAANAPSVDGNPGNGEVTYAYSDSADGTYSATVPTNAGTWYVKATVAETANYQGATTEPLSFAIAQASITLTADDKRSVYGEDIVDLTYQSTGNIKAGDDLGVTLNTEATSASNADDYTITIGWNQNANYSATLNNGTYTIEKATLDTSTLTEAQKPVATEPIYTGAEYDLLTAPAELPSGYTGVQYSTDGGATWSDDIPTGTDAGSYSVKVKYVGDGNHYDAVADVDAVINVRPSGMLIATMVSEGDTSLKLSWAGAEGVGGYDIYFKVCDGKGNYPLIATVEGGDVTSYTVTGLAKNRSYKAYVRAWIKNGGSKQYVLSSSPTVHAYTANGTKKIANPGSLTLKTPSMTVKLGKTKSIKATVKTVKKGNLATHVAKLRYISSNTSVATVTSKGKVKAVGAGSCKIYVLTTNGIWKTVTVTVDTNPTKVSISKPSKTMKVGATQNLGAKVKLTPAKAITTLKWKSSKPSVATVDANGVVTAIKKGKTVITVTTANGKKAKVTIKVK